VTSAPLAFHYHFAFDDGSAQDFTVRLDPDTLEAIDRPATPPPDWARLDNHRCANCPLAGKAEFCPVAANLSQVVEAFKDAASHDRALVTVRTRERTYQQETSLQRGLSSIMGIYNVTSGCPVLDRLRPMVRFHLPFASPEETVYRAVSMYLTAQHFVRRKGGSPDWALADLTRTYEAVEDVERGLAARLRHASADDATVNAVIVLSAFGQEVRFLLDGRLREIEHWFSPCTDVPASTGPRLGGASAARVAGFLRSRGGSRGREGALRRHSC
jgi:hypothetical protein